MAWSPATANGRPGGAPAAVAGVAGFLAGAAAAVLAAANGTAAWIDGLVARYREGRRSRRRRRAASAAARAAAAASAAATATAPTERRVGEQTRPADPGPTLLAPDPSAVRNGRVDGAGAPVGWAEGPADPLGGTPVGAPGDLAEATEPWWLPSHMEDAIVEAPRRRRRRVRRRGAYETPATRAPVVTGLRAAFGRTARWFGRVVAALAAPPDRRRRGWLPTGPPSSGWPPPTSPAASGAPPGRRPRPARRPAARPATTRTWRPRWSACC